MVIQHNMLAMNANRMFLNTNKKKAALSEKLSTGYKINRAADDAAGLAISEKMRRQIRGLTQASANAQDGISLVQIADGAMNEIHDMLHRGTELSIKAANGTLTDEDRSYIQMEIDQLVKEIDNITEKTTFNEIQVFQWDEVSNQGVTYVGGLPTWVTHTQSNNLGDTFTTQEAYTITDTNTTPPTITHGTANIDHAAANIDFSSFTGSASQIHDLIGNGFHTTCCTCNSHYSIEFTNGTGSQRSVSGQHYIYQIGIDGCTSGSDIIDRIIRGTNNGYPNSHYTKFAKDPANSNKLIVYDDRAKELDTTVYANNGITLQTGQSLSWANTWDNKYFNTRPSGNSGLFGPGVAFEPKDYNYVNIGLQIGSEAGQHLTIDLPRVSAKILGVLYADVSTITGADDAITIFKNANEIVSHERSRMGAYQNRLEHTINNLDNITENTQKAESEIRDTDIALTMLEFSNNSILAQAGASMLAQANQSRQEVMALFQ